MITLTEVAIAVFAGLVIGPILHNIYDHIVAYFSRKRKFAKSRRLRPDSKSVPIFDARDVPNPFKVDPKREAVGPITVDIKVEMSELDEIVDEIIANAKKEVRGIRQEVGGRELHKGRWT